MSTGWDFPVTFSPQPWQNLAIDIPFPPWYTPKQYHWEAKKVTNVMIGMSGGVDSSVAAYLTKTAGHPCMGAYMCLHCPKAQDALDAQAVAQKLGIPFTTLDFQEPFRRQVVEPFVESYRQGLTPNPCVRCNRAMKFGLMLETAQAMGWDAVASGHYARIRRDEATGRYLLYQAADPNKDQSYFLASLSQAQLSRIHFPLGELTKGQAREIALEQGLVTARKRDSQDICFIPDGDYAAFLAAYTGRPLQPGPFLNLQGQVVGLHRGAECYTRGQRKGLGLALGEPIYVVDKDMAANTVTVGPNQALFSQGLLAKDWQWYPFPTLEAPLAVTAKIRHSQRSHPATVYPLEDGLAQVVFQTPQRAVTPGQAVVLYQGELVVGGGTITEALPEPLPG